MDYMEDAKWEVLNYLKKQSVDAAKLDETVINEMAYRYYKNYYSYEMDSEPAVAEAVKEILGIDNAELSVISDTIRLTSFEV